MQVVANLRSHRVHLGDGLGGPCHVASIGQVEHWIISPILGLPSGYSWCEWCRPWAELKADELRAAGVGI